MCAGHKVHMCSKHSDRPGPVRVDVERQALRLPPHRPEEHYRELGACPGAQIPRTPP